jgi:hypothetical protein
VLQYELQGPHIAPVKKSLVSSPAADILRLPNTLFPLQTAIRLRLLPTRLAKSTAGLAGGIPFSMRSPSCRRLASTLTKPRLSAAPLIRFSSLGFGHHDDGTISMSAAPHLRGRQPNRHGTSLLSRAQIRGKKTKTTVNLADLPQGPIKSEPLTPAEEDEGPAYPTVVLQARRNMQKFENCVLLTRVGGFYELYFNHAEEYGPLLNLKVAQKWTNAGYVPMVGSLAPSPLFL